MAKRKLISEMQPGEVGWTVPWAYDLQSDSFDVSFPVESSGGGSLEILVECIRDGKYKVTIPPECTFRW